MIPEILCLFEATERTQRHFSIDPSIFFLSLRFARISYCQPLKPYHTHTGTLSRLSVSHIFDDIIILLNYGSRTVCAHTADDALQCFYL